MHALNVDPQVAHARVGLGAVHHRADIRSLHK
jgi:hypothetical protein